MSARATGKRPRRRPRRTAAEAACAALCAAMLAAASMAVRTEAARTYGQAGIASFTAAYAAEAAELAGADAGCSPDMGEGLQGDDIALLMEFEGDVGVGVKGAASAALRLAPEEALSRMASAGWKVVFTATRDLREFVSIDASREPVGVCAWREREIFVKATVQCAATTTLHEVSHWIDRDSGWASSGEEWASAYEAEREAYRAISAYAASDAREMFAEVCNDVLLGRSDNVKAAPRCAALAEECLRRYGFEAEE